MYDQDEHTLRNTNDSLTSGLSMADGDPWKLHQENYASYSTLVSYPSQNLLDTTKTTYGLRKVPDKVVHIFFLNFR